MCEMYGWHNTTKTKKCYPGGICETMSVSYKILSELRGAILLWKLEVR